ncbi:hypothetical protein CO174_00760 [Candidatus Uhrbacteria bacterium CG_4_9_14_3_um_filter_50_9]|uniref:Phosphotyrosine protein phosphatase I domain-containing protein n=1 Tax=Candidatus Uhrbacteria bacterium CG_4_9_14_3_um_filter_50_9 TaxID=1975035 RepID=A0A2M7XE55_9BACT|nr:MAG: hypothetical protein CO174_00760 [Candidatus Uhrbacteria bacterium CG_4_9_14_3_um_filter_50_9]
MKTALNIVVICQHGRHLSRYLQEYLESMKIESSALGLNFKNRNTIRKIQSAQIVICVHEEIKQAVEAEFDLSDKKVICLNVTDFSGTSNKKPMTGESWLEYQESNVYPELRKQIKKHLPSLA